MYEATNIADQCKGASFKELGFTGFMMWPDYCSLFTKDMKVLGEV
jgi:hypothetical protein